MFYTALIPSTYTKLRFSSFTTFLSDAGWIINFIFEGTCRENHSWHCFASSQCIHRSNICDGQYQCGDYSDESSCSRYYNCYTKSIFNMYYYQPYVSNSNCIPAVLVCDGVVDCMNQSDELNCNFYWNTSLYFRL